MTSKAMNHQIAYLCRCRFCPGSLESSEGRARGESVVPRISRNIAYPWLPRFYQPGRTPDRRFFFHSCTPVPFAARILFLLSRLQGRETGGGRRRRRRSRGSGDSERSRLRTCACVSERSETSHTAHTAAARSMWLSLYERTVRYALGNASAGKSAVRYFSNGKV